MTTESDKTKLLNDLVIAATNYLREYRGQRWSTDAGYVIAENAWGVLCGASGFVEVDQELLDWFPKEFYGEEVA